MKQRLPGMFQMRLVRYSCALLAAITALIVVGLLALNWFARTEVGHNWAKAQIESISLAGQKIQIEGLQKNLLGEFTFQTLEVSDENGVWLRASDVSIDWSPYSLVLGGLNIQTVRADELEIERQPKLLQRESAVSEESGTFISKISIGNAEVARLSIAPAIAGADFSAKFQGSLNTDIKSGEVVIDLLPSVADQDVIKADFAWGGETPFAGSLYARGPEDGLLHRLIADGSGDLELTLEGQGRTENWAIASKLVLGDSVVVEASGRRLDEKILGEAKIDPARFNKLNQYSDYFGGSINLSVDQTGDRLRATLESKFISAVASAPVGDKESLVDLNVIDVERLQIAGEAVGVSPMTFAEIKSSGSLFLAEQSVQFDGVATASNISYEGFQAKQIETSLNVNYGIEDGQFQFLARPDVTGFFSEPEEVSRLLGRNFSLNMDANGSVPERMISIKAGKLLTQSGRLDLAGDLSADLIALTGSLRANTDALNVPVEVQDEITFSVSRTNSNDIEIGVSGHIIPNGIEIVGVSGPLNVDARFAIDSAFRVNVENLAVRNKEIEASVSGEVSSGDVNLDVFLRGNVSSSQRDVKVDGIDLSGSVSGSVNDLIFDGIISASTLNVSHIYISQLKAPFSVTIDEGSPTIQVTASGITPHGNATLVGAASLQRGRFDIDRLEASLGEFSLRGSVSGTGVQLPAFRADLEFGGTLPKGLPAKSLRGNLRIGNEEIAVDAVASEVVFGHINLTDVSLTSTGTPQAGMGKVSLNGYYDIGGDRPSVRAQIPVTWRDMFKTADIELSAEIDREVLGTRSPVLIERQHDSYSVTGEIFGLGGRLRANANLDLLSPKLELNLAGVQAGAIAKLFRRPPLTGEIAGQASLQTENGRLNGSGMITGRSIGQPTLESRKANLDFRFELNDDEVTLNADLLGNEDDTELSAIVTLPVETPGQPLSLRPSTTRPIFGRIAGQGQLGAAWSLVGSPEVRIDGVYNVSSSVAGTLKSPILTGSLNIADGEFEGGTTGFALKGIELSSTYSSTELIVSDLTAEGINGGSLNGRGLFAFVGASDVAISLNKISAFRRDDLSSTLSGELEFLRENKGAKLSGEVYVDRADYNLDKLPGGSLTTIDVRFPSQQEDSQETEDIIPISMDVRINAPRRVFVSGSGVQSEWSLNLGVSGPLLSPQIFGEAKIERGEVDFLGREFEFTESSIVFAGDATNPRLNIGAERATTDMIARIVVTGDANDPLFELSSDPNLPNDEILARVLFGRSPSQLSTFQAAQLGLSLASLTGGESPLDVVGSLEDVLNIDRLDFGLSEEGKAMVGAGRYLAEDVYLEVRSDTSGTPGVSVEWTPQRNLEIVGDIDSTAAPKIAVRWKRDFDMNRPGRNPVEERDPDPELPQEGATTKYIEPNER